MKRIFTRGLLLLTLLASSVATIWAQKSVLDENFANGSLPSGWTKANSYWEFASGNAQFEAPFQDAADTLFTPVLNLSSLNNKPSVAVRYLNRAYNDKLNELKVLYRENGVGEWHVLKIFAEGTSDPTDWKDVLPEGLSSVQVAIAAANKNGAETRIYRLAVENKTEASAAPTGLRYEDLTTTSVTLWWNVCESSQWQQYNVKVSSIRLANPSEEAGNVIDMVGWGITDEFYELADLTPNTGYWLYVQYDCGDGDVSPWAELEFRTPCSAIRVPFVENFEDDLLDCFTIIQNGSAAAMSSEFPHNSAKAFKSVSKSGTNNYLILPESSAAVKQYQVSFWAAAQENGNVYARTITVGVCNEATASSFTELTTLNLPVGRRWEQINVSLAGYKGNGKYIAFRFGNADKENRVFIDDIRIEAASECPKPIFVTASAITPESASLRWTKAGGENEWNLVVSTVPLTDPEDIEPDAAKGEFAGSISTNPYNLIGLKPQTTYYVYLQAACGSSEWTNAVTFTTGKAVTIPFAETFDRFDADFYTDDITAVPEGWLMDCRNINPQNTYYDRPGDNYPYVTRAKDHSGSAYVPASLLLKSGAWTTETNSQTSIAILPAMPEDINKLMIKCFAYADHAGAYLMVGVANSQVNDLAQGNQMGGNIIVVDSVLLVNNSWNKYALNLKNYSGTGRYIVLFIKPGDEAINVYVDDLEVDLIPDCYEVTELTAVAMTSSVKLTWSDATSATQWNVKISTTSIDPTSADGNVVSTTTTKKNYTAIGLTMGQKYYIYVSPSCGDQWVSTEVTTPVGLQIPYYNDFTNEATGSGKAPVGWVTGNAAGSTSNSYKPYVYNTAWTAATGSSIPADVSKPCLYFYAYKNNNANAYIPYAILPEILNADVKDLKITFWGWTDKTIASYSHMLRIGVLADPTDITTLTQVDSVELTTLKVPQRFSVDMSSYTGSGKYIVFYINEGNLTGYFYLDNLVITIASAPQKVSDIVVSNKTETGATLTWTENGDATEWNIRLFSEQPENIDEETPVFSTTVTGTPTVNVSGLVHSTHYFACIQAQKGEEKGEWVSCDFWSATGTWSLPFVETFNSYEIGSDSKNTLPGFYSITGSTYQPFVKNVQSTTAGALDGYALNMQTTSSKKISQLVLPGFNQPVNRLQLTLHAQGNGSYVNYETFTLIGVMEGDNFVAIDSFMIKTKGEWAEFHFDFSKYNGTGTQIAIRQDYDASNLNSKPNTFIVIDNIVVDAIADCGRVKNIRFSNVSDKSANATWNAVNGETEWRIKVSNTILTDSETQEGNVLSTTVVTSNNFLIENLYEDMDYYVYVQSKKGDNVGQWSVPALLHTKCSPMTLPASWDFNSYSDNTTVIPGNECLSFVGTSRDLKKAAFSYKITPFTTYHMKLAQEKATDNNYLVLPEMDVDSVAKLQVSMKIRTGGSTATKQDFFEIGVMSDPADASTYWPVCSDALTQSNTIIYDRTYPLSGYKGDERERYGKYIAIRVLPSTGNSAGAIYIDDICVDYISACAKPLDVIASDIEEEGATLSWSADPTDASFDVRLLSSIDGDKNEPLVQTIVSGDTTVDLTLSSNTQYYAFVRKQCGENSYSDWSAPCAIRTDCGTVQTLPYSDDFEAYAANTVPACWTVFKTNGSGGPSVSTSAKKDGVNGLTISSTSGTGTPPPYYPAGFVTPALDINSPRDLTIIFDMKGTSNNYKLQIDAVKSPTSTAADEVVNITTLTSKNTWEKVYLKVADISTYTSNNEFKYIRFMQVTKQQTIYIDNLIISKDAMVTLPVSGLAPTVVSDSSISFTFQEVTPGISSWQVAYGKSGEFDKPAKSYAGQVIDTTDYTLNGLESNTRYDIYVRANSTDAAWVGPISAKTANAPATIPYHYAFEDVDENANQWTFVSAGSGNSFIIGNAATCGATGEKALYITNDGTSYAYNLKSGWAWALRDIRFDKIGNHTISLRAKIPGNAELNQDQDALYAILVPAGAKVGTGDGSIRDYEKIILLNGNSFTYSTGNNAQNNVYSVFSRKQKVSEWTWLEAKVNIANAGDYSLALIWFSNTFGTAGQPAAIDEIEVKQYECTAVSQLELQSLSSYQASFNWFAGECKNFEYVLSRYANLNNPVGIDDADKIAAGTTADRYIHVNGLQPSTKYSLYVRTICVGEETDWAELDFRTPCEAEVLPYIETFSEQPECWRFSNAVVTSKNYQSEEMAAADTEVEHWSVLQLNAGGYAILPDLNVSINQINVEMGLFSSMNLGAVELGVIDNLLDANSFQTLARFETHNKLESECIGSCGNPYVVEVFRKMLNLYQGAGKLLAIRNGGSNTVYVKYISLTTLPECITPQQLEFTQVQEKQATVNWLAGTEDKWEMRVDDNEPFVVTSNPYVLTGLEQGTSYAVSIRAICDATHMSEWSTSATFQTSCGTSSLPLLENFDALKRNSAARLNCWENLYSEDSIKYVFSGVETLHSTELINSMYYVWSTDIPTRLGDYHALCSYVPSNTSANKRYRWFVSPQLAIDGSATLSFDARYCNVRGEAVTTQGHFYVAVSTDNGVTWQKANATDLTSQLTPEFTNLSVSLNKYAGQTVRVAFYHEALDNRKSDEQSYLIIDNVRINCSETYSVSDGACFGYDYQGNGFTIAKSELAPAGQSREYTRLAHAEGIGCDSTIVITLTTHQSGVDTVYASICQGETYDFGPYHLSEPNPVGTPYYITGETQYGCDSTIYLYLTVNPSDTSVIAPIEVDVNQLPYQVDELFTIPAGTAIGDLVEIVKVDACHFNRYAVTVKDLATGLIYINSDVDHVDVYDILGRKIQTIAPQVGELQLHLPTGVYMLRTTMTNGQIATSKISIK